MPIINLVQNFFETSKRQIATAREVSWFQSRLISVSYILNQTHSRVITINTKKHNRAGRFTHVVNIFF